MICIETNPYKPTKLKELVHNLEIEGINLVTHHRFILTLALKSNKQYSLLKQTPFSIGCIEEGNSNSLHL